MKKNPIIILTIVIVLALIIGTYARADESFYLETRGTDKGTLMRVINDAPSTRYCWVVYDNGYGHFDFYVDAYSKSRWYYEPRSHYDVGCS